VDRVVGRQRPDDHDRELGEPGDPAAAGPDPLPQFFRRPIGSSGIDGTHDFDNRSVYVSDTFGATNGTKSLKG
jgi:hypothetical protein